MQTAAPAKKETASGTKKVSGYEVIVKGQYYSASGKDKTVKHYGPETFFLPEIVEIVTGRKIVPKMVDGVKVKSSEVVKAKMNAMRCAQHVVQRRLLIPRLQEKHPDFVAFRTCHIVDQKRVMVDESRIENFTDKPISQMTLAELRSFCAYRSLTTQLDAFRDLDDARLAVQDEMDMIEQATSRAKSTDPALTDPEIMDPSAVDATVPGEDEDPADDLI